ncbi:MAG: hypothetical protein PHT32_04135 [Candidatus Omnitrophica bacterium]|nr:hypothetical protein [Candidatus Omnitrophota bacterium]
MKELPFQTEAALLLYFRNAHKFLKPIFPFLGEVTIAKKEEIIEFLDMHPYFFSRKRDGFLCIYGGQVPEMQRQATVENTILKRDALSYAVFFYFYANFSEAYFKPDETIFTKKLLIKKMTERIFECCNYVLDNTITPDHNDIRSPGRMIELLTAASDNFMRTSVPGIAKLPELTKNLYAPDTKRAVISRIENPLRNLYAENQDTIDTIIVSPGCAENYNYRTFIILKDNVCADSIDTLFMKIKSLYSGTIADRTLDYFRQHRFPLVLTNGLFQALGLSFSKKVTELFVVSRHGEVVCGNNDFIKKLTFVPLYVKAGLYTTLSEFPILTRFIFWSDTSQHPSGRSVATLVDYVCGIIPAMHLILAKNIIVTSQREAYPEYRDLCPKEYLGWFDDFYGNFSGKSIEVLKKTDMNSVYPACLQYLNAVLHEIEKEKGRYGKSAVGEHSTAHV